jgi:release factor glutamine methyltransferase
VRLVERLRAAGCVFAEDEARVLTEAAGSAEELEAMVVRRVAGEPLELVVGYAEFCGLRIAVAPGVFVPRQRSALLVASAIELVGAQGCVVDLGCGTGALAAALVAARPGVSAYAVDVDPAAVAVARRNLPTATVLEGDLYDPLPPALRGAVDVVLANAPYVPTGRIGLMPREARDFEHRVALDGGEDGLDVQRRVVAEAPAWLRPGGVLLVETSTAQLPLSVAAMRAAGLAVRVEQDDESGGTVVLGCRGPDTAGGPA